MDFCRHAANLLGQVSDPKHLELRERLYFDGFDLNEISHIDSLPTDSDKRVDFFNILMAAERFDKISILLRNAIKCIENRSIRRKLAQLREKYQDEKGAKFIARFRGFIVSHFSESDLRTICFDHYRELLNDIPDPLAVSKLAPQLITHCERRGMLRHLIGVIRNARPKPFCDEFPNQCI